MNDGGLSSSLLIGKQTATNDKISNPSSHSTKQTFNVIKSPGLTF